VSLFSPKQLLDKIYRSALFWAEPLAPTEQNGVSLAHVLYHQTETKLFI
jgi:hypothetical protein